MIIFLILFRPVCHDWLKSTLSLPESVMETFKVILTIESVDDFLWCGHSNETSLAVLLRGTIYI